MGKTQKGALWLDPEKTSPYDFYQYWRNVDDADVIKCIKMITFLPLEEIAELEKLEGAELNKAKEILAFETTKLIHGEEEAKKAQEAARALFAGGSDSADIPTAEFSDSDFTDGKLNILDLLVKSGLAPSKSEARRNVQQGGVSIDGEKIADVNAEFTAEYIREKGSIVAKRGKKAFRKILIREDS